MRRSRIARRGGGSRRLRPLRSTAAWAGPALRRLLPEAAALGDRLLPRKYVKLALQLASAARGTPLARFHAHFASRATHVAMLASLLLGVPFSFTAHAKDIYHHEVDPDVLRVKMCAAELVVTVSDYNRRTLLSLA